MNEEVDHVLKMVFIGDASVGKTSILNRFTEGVFDPEQACTVGVDFKLHVVNARDNIRQGKKNFNHLPRATTEVVTLSLLVVGGNSTLCDQRKCTESFGWKQSTSCDPPLLVNF
eukprot:TRINITY_DN2793_c0_g1_i6.p1 TRINITY_DN2793_c0_g1~~TRINITY_DN2793_c0_g1_i6.p1  ORF type:complete len:114 (-),score=15.24 TRINITY_DN2793_c0_g1_i6:438-779(-)